ncbi:mucin-3A-like [Anopheles albimanus]|uniref:mucin-3A-like n=1 Tax=Anopheles albimanus TaxID=7167 RepID=UPI00163F0971|nr:mucin-3A-like [Anopheles albimanus]
MPKGSGWQKWIFWTGLLLVSCDAQLSSTDGRNESNAGQLLTRQQLEVTMKPTITTTKSPGRTRFVPLTPWAYVVTTTSTAKPVSDIIPTAEVAETTTDGTAVSETETMTAPISTTLPTTVISTTDKPSAINSSKSMVSTSTYTKISSITEPILETFPIEVTESTTDGTTESETETMTTPTSTTLPTTAISTTDKPSAINSSKSMVSTSTSTRIPSITEQILETISTEVAESTTDSIKHDPESETTTARIGTFSTSNASLVFFWSAVAGFMFILLLAFLIYHVRRLQSAIRPKATQPTVELIKVLHLEEIKK